MKKRFGRVLALALALVLTVGLLPAPARAAAASGTCGENLTWSLTSGVLTISGTGAMNDYTSDVSKRPPWYTRTVTSVNIEAGVTSIGNYAFHANNSLTSVTIPDSVTSIGNYAFYNCSRLTNTTIPSSVTSIGVNAFNGCSTLTSVTIPNSVTSIANYAFAHCTSLTSVTIPDGVTSIGNDAFRKCTSLTSVTIPNSVTSIGEYAFYQCTALTGVTIPDGVTSIGAAAFARCDGLTSVTVPASVTSIEASAFSYCPSLTSFSVDESNPNYSFYDNALHSKDGTALFAWPPYGDNFAIPDGVTTVLLGVLSETVFDYEMDGRAAVVPKSVTVIRPGLELYLGSGTYVPIFETVYYAGSPDDLALVEGGGYDNTTLYFLPSIQLDAAGITAGDENPTVTITSDTGFKEDISKDDITFNSGATGLTLASVSLGTTVSEDTIDGEPYFGVDDKVLILQFAGTAKAGNLDITVKDSAFYWPVGTIDGAVNPSIPTIAVSGGSTPTPPDPPTPPDTPTTPTRPTQPVQPVNPGYTPSPSPSASPEPETSLPGAGVNPPPVPPLPESPLQGIVTDETNVVNWGDRLNLPEYARDLYDALSEGSDDKAATGREHFLVEDRYFTLPVPSADNGGQDVLSMEKVDFDLADLYGDGKPSLGVSVFENDDFYRVDATAADRQVNYPALQPGDVVRTASYNGVFVTSVTVGTDFNEQKKLTCTYISTVFQAFDRDHPEIFWLSGQCRICIPTIRFSDGTSEAYFFLVLADKDGFTMRSPNWQKDGAVADGIQRREKAAEVILATVTAETPAEIVRQLNRWLTEHNQYNTTPDLTTIGNEPHECLSALEGRIGTVGPVCDGYSRAFKLLCDRLEIPCVLENGYAKTSPQDKGTLHMWNAVQIGGQWYGMDVTWNDPEVKGCTEAKSGKENEQFLLVGASTVVLGMRFDASHPATNQASADGVSFDNGPELSSAAFSAGTANAGLYAMPFVDVAAGAWYYGNVAYVYQWNLMLGTGPNTFTPGGLTTRQQLWMILARMDGKQPRDMAAARDWAVGSGVSDGSNPGGTLTREQLVAMLYRYCGLKGYDTSASASLAQFTDGGAVSDYARQAMAWAAANGIVTGMGDGTVAPQGSATRAQMAAIMERFCLGFTR